MSYFYSVFGLNLRSQVAIPGFLDGEPATRPDIQINVERMDLPEAESPIARLWYESPPEDPDGESVVRVWRSDDASMFRFRYSYGPEFVVSDGGSQIEVRWPKNVPLDDMVTYLCGPMLGLVLQLRGVTCLHGSAVVVGDEAMVLLGAPGAGKSTTGAALCHQGYSLLSENLAVLDENREGFYVRSGYPRINLWSDSTALLYGDPEALPRITPNWDKRCLDLPTESGQFRGEPSALRCVFVFGERIADPRAPFLSELSPSERLMTLVTNTYLNYLPDARWRARDLERLGRLVALVPVRKITPHVNSARLLNLCRQLVEALRQEQDL